MAEGPTTSAQDKRDPDKVRPGEDAPESLSGDKSLPEVPVAPTMPTGSSPALAAAPGAVKRSMPMALSIAIGIILAGLLAWFFYQLTWFMLLVYLSFVLATIVDAPVNWLKNHRVPRTLGTVLILVSGLAVLGGIAYLLISSLNSQMTALAPEMKQVPVRVNNWINGFKERFPGIGDAFKDFNFADAASNMLPGAGTLWSNLTAGVGALTYIVVTFFVVMYMVIEGPDHLKAARRLLPKHARLEATRLFDAMAKAHRGWFLASMGNVASAAVLTAVGLWWIGLPGAMVFGLISGLGELIPNVGPILFALPAIVFTLVLKPDMIMWVLLLFAVIQAVQSYTITPLLMKVGVELPVLVTIVSVLVMGTLFGLLGVLVAIPLVADMVVVWNYVNTMLEKDAADYDSTNAVPATQRQSAGPKDTEGTSPETRRARLFRRNPTP